MVNADAAYVQACIDAGLLQTPCLELGIGYGGPNSKAQVRAAGIAYFGSDIHASPEVDYVVDFEGPPEEVAKGVDYTQFGSVLVLNVLEHTFDPIRVLDNIFSILKPKGTCVVITPTVWPIHNYPIDCWRINPGFYEEYCRRRSYSISDQVFDYVGIHSVRENKDPNGTYVLPLPATDKLGGFKSRLVHRAFNTFGRGMLFQSHIATGVVMVKDTNGSKEAR